jgi:biopolymer transport protein ExbD/biopolymer transport protein TolR
MSITPTREAGRVMAAINVTPMADIMIVLLIIFMVITPLLDDGGVRLPTASNAAEKPGADALVVSIREDSTIFLDDDRLDNFGELALRLNERLDAGRESSRVVYLRADESLPYSAVWTVLQVCREAGAGEVALLSQQRVGG